MDLDQLVKPNEADCITGCSDDQAPAPENPYDQPIVFEFPVTTPPEIVKQICNQIADAAARAAARAQMQIEEQKRTQARRRLLEEKGGEREQALFLAAGHYALKLQSEGHLDYIGAAALEHRLPRETVRIWTHTARRELREKRAAARDREICRLASKGLSNRQIAKEVGCAQRTVTKAVSRAFEDGRLGEV